MNKDFEIIKNELVSKSFTDNLTCFIVFGSCVANHNMGKVPGDIDICVVVNNRNANLQQISDYIFDSFENPDFRIYFEDEVKSNLLFMDKGVGVFALEYFSNGMSLFGENIFIKKLNTISHEKLKEAYLNKIKFSPPACSGGSVW